jgi:hypothetical protein
MRRAGRQRYDRLRARPRRRVYDWGAVCARRLRCFRQDAGPAFSRPRRFADQRAQLAAWAREPVLLRALAARRPKPRYGVTPIATFAKWSKQLL